MSTPYLYRCTQSEDNVMYFWRRKNKPDSAWRRVSWDQVPETHRCRKLLPKCFTYRDPLEKHEHEQVYPCRAKYTVFNRSDRLKFVKMRHANQKNLAYQQHERKAYLDLLLLRQSIEEKKQKRIQKKQKDYGVRKIAASSPKRVRFASE